MRRRRAILVFILAAISLSLFGAALPSVIEQTVQEVRQSSASPRKTSLGDEAQRALDSLPVKGRASKTGYERAQFGDGWSTVSGCSTRNIILNRDMTDVAIDDECRVTKGVLDDPYTGETIHFTTERSSDVQIDHVVALSDAWQKGAQLLTKERRTELANDPLELLAVSGAENQAKGDGDAATWLPKHKSFRCAYVARQIAVKAKYELWVTQAEKDAMKQVLAACPAQLLPRL